MTFKMKQNPKNERELVELKKFIKECDENLAKLKLEVDCISWYLTVFVKYTLDIPFEYIENFYALKTYP